MIRYFIVNVTMSLVDECDLLLETVAIWNSKGAIQTNIFKINVKVLSQQPVHAATNIVHHSAVASF